jgi:outer membrane protein assembly factor BamA
MQNKLLSNIIFLFFSIYPILSYSQQSDVQTNINIENNSGDTVKTKRSFWERFTSSNVDRSFEQAIDFSIAATPFYNQEANFGIAVMGPALYRLDRSDSIMPPSNVTLSGSISLKGFYGIFLAGNNYFKGNRSRLSYELYFNNKNMDFWGINYYDCARNPVVDYTRKRVKVYTDYNYKLTENLRISGIIDFSYDYITKIDDESHFYYLQGQKLSYTFTGVGVSFQYDSRDFIPNPKRGMYLMLQETVYPQVLGSYNKTLFRTTFTADFFQRVWKGGTLCFDLYSRFNSKNSPWPLKEALGGANRMRGYYTGRYIDNNIISAQIEIRQHLFNRFGCAAWVGAGTVFPEFKEFEFDNILPTYGFGIRWEFKHNMNLRVDYGFGKSNSGFVLSISEAF